MPKTTKTTKPTKAIKKPAVKKTEKEVEEPKKAVKKVIKTIELKDVEIESAEKDAKKKNEYLYAVGRRKTATAQIRLYKKGEGKITVNQKPIEQYFTVEEQDIVKTPLKLIGQFEKLDVTVRALGGGKHSQAEAVRHGISRALIQLNPNFRKPLKKAGFITRDPRKKERKKPGLKRARRAPQWQKR
jgi:small subunit ribosomal protein S9